MPAWPDRAAEGRLSKLREEGGAGTISASGNRRRSRSRAGRRAGAADPFFTGGPDRVATGVVALVAGVVGGATIRAGARRADDFRATRVRVFRALSRGDRFADFFAVFFVTRLVRAGGRAFRAAFRAAAFLALATLFRAFVVFFAAFVRPAALRAGVRRVLDLAMAVLSTSVD
jgi:hypothetical protein